LDLVGRPEGKRQLGRPRCRWKNNIKKDIQEVKYADDLVIMAKEETVLQGMIDKLIEIGSCYGMEMNVEKTKVMRISRQPFPVTIMIDQKQLENVECFKYCLVWSRGLCVRCSILQTGHITLSSTPDHQLENHSTKYHRQQPLYNNLELLMMGIVVPETC